MSHRDVEKIKERLGIKEVVESYIKLEKTGKNYRGRCPFHNEKTPSFFISPERDSYYCFGCGAKGDIFSFVQQFESTDFVGSLKILAERAGVEITHESSGAETKNKQLKKILEEATSHFQENLSGNKLALEYLKKRGLKEDTIKSWRIGFAADSWRELYDFLLKKGHKDSALIDAGVVKRGEKGGLYDYFRSRVMFPIFNSSGEPVAFSGRIFGAEESETAKYINSPETELFKKSEVLYGFDRAKSHIRKNDFSILVEGQMDLIMCHQAGYKNAVASSGTALTERQLGMISRISPKLVIAYDSDSAGFKASERAWQMALGLGMDVKIADLVGGKDPADIILADVKKWREAVKNSKHIIEILIQKIENEVKGKREAGLEVSEKIIPYLFMIKNKIDQAHFVKAVSDRLGIREEAIYTDLQNYKPDIISNSTDRKNKAILSVGKDQMAVEKRLFGLILWQERLPNPTIDVESARNEIREILGEEYEVIWESVKDFIDDVLFAIESSYGDEKIIKKEFKELIVNLRLKYLIKKRERLLLELKRQEQNNNEKESDQLLGKINEISKEINAINREL
ncbi:MAG TPA: DNA primase [Candidatus Paceibacterota bacterium]|nr:DNA primase [Candidatus Paceibacterota bacterium]HRZ34509.1 DNA primase [Candidatus Paceibacterota bacterium]